MKKLGFVIVFLLFLSFFAFKLPLPAYATNSINLVQSPTQTVASSPWQSYGQNGYDYSLDTIFYTLYAKANSNWGDGLKFSVTIDGAEHSLIYQSQDYSYRDVYGSQDYISSIAGVTGSLGANSISYVNAFSGVTLTYETYNIELKENYVINALPKVPANYLTEPVTLDFGGYIKYGDLSLFVKGVDKTGQNFVTSSSIDFVYNGQTAFSLPAPTASDSAGNFTSCQYEVKSQGSQIWFYTRTPYSWLENAVFPVVVDPSVRVQGNARGETWTSPLAITLDSAPTEGNMLILCFAGAGNGGYATVSSITQTGVTWTLQKREDFGGAGAETAEIWAGVVGSGASDTASIAYAATSDGACGDICEYSGLASTDFLDKTASSSAGVSTVALSGTTDITTQDDELWVACLVTRQQALSNPSDGFSLLDGTVFGWVGLAYMEKIVSSAAAASTSADMAGSNDYVGCIATFKAASAGDTAPPTYSGLSTSTTVCGASCQFNATFNDDTALETEGQYEFGINQTGSWVWDTPVNFTSTPETVSVTKTLANTYGLVVGYQWNFTDNAGNSNTTGIQTLTTTADSYTVTLSTTESAPSLGDTVTINIVVSRATGVAVSSWQANITNNGGTWGTNYAGSSFSFSEETATTHTFDVTGLYDADCGATVTPTCADLAIVWSDTGGGGSSGGDSGGFTPSTEPETPQEPQTVTTIPTLPEEPEPTCPPVSTIIIAVCVIGLIGIVVYVDQTQGKDSWKKVKKNKRKKVNWKK